jgi:hypothetical protein
MFTWNVYQSIWSASSTVVGSQEIRLLWRSNFVTVFTGRRHWSLQPPGVYKIVPLNSTTQNPLNHLPSLSQACFVIQKRCVVVLGVQSVLACDRRTASSKVSSLLPLLKFQYILSSRSSSSCLRHPPPIFFPSLFPSITWLEGSSYARRDQSIQSSFILLYAGCSFPPWLCVKLLHFSNTIGQADPLHPYRTPRLKILKAFVTYFPS